MSNAPDKISKTSLTSSFLAIGETALRSYDVECAQIDFISHGENATFRVEAADGQVYLLRVHHPASSHFPAACRRREAIESELEWLSALNHDTNLVVPQPVQTQNGKWIACVSREDFPETLCCTLLRWIEGEHPAHPLSIEQARNIGAAVAHVHAHGAQWNKPIAFTRPRYDMEWFHRCLDNLARGIDLGLIARPDFEILRQATECLAEEMKDLGEKEEVWGLIHGDVFDCNILVSDGKIGLIDFSSCGFGHFALDLASLVLHFAWKNRECAKAILDGYQSIRPLPQSIDSSLAVFPVARILDDLSYIQTRPERHEKMKNMLVPCSVEYCRDYLNGRVVLFESTRTL